MSHQDSGHYAAKHPGKAINPAIADELKTASVKEEIYCTKAHKIAEKNSLSPAEIGIQADLAELRISRCEMGLFGYSPQKKRLNPDIQISEELDREIEKNQTDGRISCARCWDLASGLGISRMDMGSACEKKGIRVKPCQLGAF